MIRSLPRRLALGAPLCAGLLVLAGCAGVSSSTSSTDPAEVARWIETSTADGVEPAAALDDPAPRADAPVHRADAPVHRADAPVHRADAPVHGAGLAVVDEGPGGPGGGEEPDDDELLARHGLTGLDARAAIALLGGIAVSERPTDIVATVLPARVHITAADSGRTLADLPLPEDEFYLAVAPHESFNHPCQYYSLTICLGEMAGEQVDVTVVDEDTGRTVIDESRTLDDSGFTGLWLPRDLRGTLTVSHDGLSGTAEIASGPDDATCLSTMRLT